MDKTLRWLKGMEKDELAEFERDIRDNALPIKGKGRQFALGYIEFVKQNKFRPDAGPDVWKTVFPDEEFKDVAYRKRKSLLNKDIERFWILKAAREAPSRDRERYFVLKKLWEIGHNQEFETRYFRYWKEFDPNRLGSVQQFEDAIALVELGYDYFLQGYYRGEPTPILSELYEMRERLVTELFVLDRCKRRCADLNRSWLHSDFPLADPPEQTIRDLLGGKKTLMLVDLYKKLWEAAEKDSLENIRAFVELYLRQRLEVEAPERQLMCSYLLNQLIRKYHAASEESIAQWIDQIYYAERNSEVLHDTTGNLHIRHLKNWINVRLFQNHKEAARTLFKQYANVYDPSSLAGEIYRFCGARILFAEGRFKDCYLLIQELKWEDNLKIENRILQLKCLVEMWIAGDENRKEEAERKLENAYSWLRRTQLSDAELDLHRRRLLALKRIIVGGNDISETEKTEIEQLSSHDAAWLLEKYKQLNVTFRSGR